MKHKAKKQSPLAAIEDFYIRKGFEGGKLWEALRKDTRYQQLLLSRKKKLSKKFRPTKRDSQRYVLSTDKDYEILEKIYQLEKKRLTAEDKKLVRFIRSQLELDWRRQIIKELDRLAKKYEK